MKYLILTLMSLAILFPAGKSRAQQSETFAKDVARVESYLQNLGSARARFVQTTHDGTQLVGTFYLKRPGKLRFEYDDPIKDFVVADGFFIYFYDAELGQQTNAPIGQTLADFFLRKNVSLNEDVKVQSIRHPEDTKGSDLMQVELAQASDPEAGSLTLGFKENNGELSLSKWRVVDGQGLITEIELFYLKTDITHPSGLFTYKDPNAGPKGYNE